MKQYEGLFILDTQDSAEGVDAIIKALGRFEVTDLSTEEPTLEEAFLRYYSDETE